MKIKEVIVVEGKNDTHRLKQFFECETFETKGLNLNKETLQYIAQLNKKRGVIIFTDPDNPGEKIRNWINQNVEGCKNAFVLKEDAKTSKKVGIEHASESTLKAALTNLITFEKTLPTLSNVEFIELGLSGSNDSQIRRDYLSKIYHLGKCNAKTMLKRLNLLGLTYQEIQNTLEKVQD